MRFLANLLINSNVFIFSYSIGWSFYKMLNVDFYPVEISQFVDNNFIDAKYYYIVSSRHHFFFKLIDSKKSHK